MLQLPRFRYLPLPCYLDLSRPGSYDHGFPLEGVRFHLANFHRPAITGKPKTGLYS